MPAVRRPASQLQVPDRVISASLSIYIEITDVQSDDRERYRERSGYARCFVQRWRMTECYSSLSLSLSSILSAFLAHADVRENRSIRMQQPHLDKAKSTRFPYERARRFSRVSRSKFQSDRVCHLYACIRLLNALSRDIGDCGDCKESGIEIEIVSWLVSTRMRLFLVPCWKKVRDYVSCKRRNIMQRGSRKKRKLMAAEVARDLRGGHARRNLQFNVAV
jgi:hypothetical protein